MFFWLQKIHLVRYQSLILFMILSLYANTALGDDKESIYIDTSYPVIYCNVSLNIEKSTLETALKEGSQMTYHWNIVIEEVRNYWLNKEVGQVAFQRQVIPDLVSRQWLLKDSNSGITNTTFSKGRAIYFLTHLKKFPVIDKSLLQQGKVYRLRIKLYIEEGEVNESWWAKALKLGKTVAIGSFSLP